MARRGLKKDSAQLALGLAHVTTDAEARIAALDPTRSFIVQAPAGSGKTGLLVQRFLRLLSTVDVPEQIVALTFTLKAAAEMRGRVLEALRNVDDNEAAAKFGRRTRELARLARERSDARGWNLAMHPSRLRVQTIDAFCHSLAGRLPLLARAGAELVINDEPQPLYASAARRTLDLIEEREPIAALLLTLLAHRDNQLLQTEELLIKMLERREQWLPFVVRARGETLRQQLERSLQLEIEAHLESVAARWPQGAWVETVALLSAAGSGSAGPKKEGGGGLGTTYRDLPAWQELAGLLLTTGNDWRKQLNARSGHATTAAVELGRHLIEQLKPVPRLREQLKEMRRLPPPHFSEAQWEVVQALLEVLRTAAAQLEIVFRETGEVDFPALVQAAVYALGSPEEPGELALALDYRIRHLLLDEFQDTSFKQIELLEALTAGWEEGDGRTLFCVGDPMQSIYRFRQAEVGLFLRTRDHGLNSIRPDLLQLTRNFRSHRNLVEWFNEVFARVLPDADDLTRGAVRHVASATGREEAGHAAVHVHCAFAPSWRDEALRVADLVASRHVRGSDRTIGILVRNRRHALEIAAILRERKLPFQAIELETLESQPVVRDLMALSRALLHLGDRTAWLAVLRSPVCGLTLADLTALTRDDEYSTCWELLNQATRLDSLSADGARRVRAMMAPLSHALDKIRREPVRDCVERTWMALGGPATLQEPRALEDAQAFFQRLEELASRDALEPGPALEVGFADLYARPDPTAGPQIQIMTIHQAKGLEFDIVVLPRLGDGRSASDEPLLRWLEIPHAVGGPGLLLAPIGQKGSQEDPLFEYLKRRERERDNFERARLLYVAVTRAADELHLFGHVRLRDGEPGEPEVNSLLSLLWPAVEERFARAFEELERPPDKYGAGANPASATIQRHTPAWSLPAPPAGIAVPQAPQVEAATSIRPEFDWASETSRRVGTLVHQELESWSRQGSLPDADALRARAGNFRRRLQASGVPADRLESGVDRVIEALIRTREDARGRWILASTHREARNELALTGYLEGELVRVVIDRTFVDDSGQRWIIDFKTSGHEGGDRETFLDREVERYRAQLELYARLLDAGSLSELRLGLYFPLMGGWREWRAGEAPQ